ncbi:MAG: Bactoprenol glucosyl transferase, partial [uncultured bacterium]
MKKVSLVIPVYNSEKSLSWLISGLIQVLSRAKKNQTEIILVNDGSRDHSDSVCKSLLKRYSNIKYISLSKNFGQHNAILTGMRFTRGDYVLVMDDDLQTPPEAVPLLIEEIEKTSADVVFAKYQSTKDFFFRKLASKINQLTNIALNSQVIEIDTTSFFIIKKFLVREIIKY